MTTAADILEELKILGDERSKEVLIKHGAREPFYGVKVEALKKIEKRIRKDHQLALDLYDTGVSDAMYLAGLIADPPRMTRAELQAWAEQAYWSMLSEYTVAWTAAESPFGMELALEWIESPEENIATAGWATISNIVLLKPDAELDILKLHELLLRVKDTIHNAPNRVRYVMNGFIIALGGGVAGLTGQALEVAAAIGKVNVLQGETACKVPDAGPYIRKMIDKGYIGKKRKQARC